MANVDKQAPVIWWRWCLICFFRIQLASSRKYSQFKNEILSCRRVNCLFVGTKFSVWKLSCYSARENFSLITVPQGSAISFFNFVLCLAASRNVCKLHKSFSFLFSIHKSLYKENSTTCFLTGVEWSYKLNCLIQTI